MSGDKLMPQPDELSMKPEWFMLDGTSPCYTLSVTGQTETLQTGESIA
jgi:hypothetical protein